MRAWVPVVAGSTFCAAAALGADRAAWVEAMANSFLPYVAVPLASGFLVRRTALSYAVRAALIGAGSSLALVLAFYGTTALISFYALSTWGIFYWGTAALISGATFALLSWWAQPIASRHLVAFGAALCTVLVAAQTTVILGPSRYSGKDVLGLTIIVLLCCTLILLAMRTGSRMTADPKELRCPGRGNRSSTSA